MAIAETIATEAGDVHIVCTSIADGDFAVSGDVGTLIERRSTLVDQPWTWLRQVHGNTVLHVSYPGEQAGAEADGLVTAATGAPIGVVTADCAPLAMVGSRGFAIVHAGWRGIVAGVIDQASAALAELGSDPLLTLLGPCIGPASYAFGPEDLAPIEESFGADIRALTKRGELALDLPTLIGLACIRSGWMKPTAVGGGDMICTSSTDYFSHRTRRDTGRQTMVGWIVP